MWKSQLQSRSIDRIESYAMMKLDDVLKVKKRFHIAGTTETIILDFEWILDLFDEEVRKEIQENVLKQWRRKSFETYSARYKKWITLRRFPNKKEDIDANPNSATYKTFLPRVH